MVWWELALVVGLAEEGFIHVFITKVLFCANFLKFKLYAFQLFSKQICNS